MEDQIKNWNEIFIKAGVNRPKIDNWLDKFGGILDESLDTPIIDLGCGFGNDTLYLSEKGFKVISCDYSEEALNRLKYFIPEPDTRLFNMLDGLPFETSSATVIIADLSLHYFCSEDTFRILNEISRVLIKDGYLICRVNSINDTEFGAGQGIELEENYFDIAGNYKRFFDKKQVMRFFSDWCIEFKEECEMDRYQKLKKVWVLLAKNCRKKL